MGCFRTHRTKFSDLGLSCPPPACCAPCSKMLEKTRCLKHADVKDAVMKTAEYEAKKAVNANATSKFEIMERMRQGAKAEELVNQVS